MFKKFTLRYRCNINDISTVVTEVLQSRMKYVGSNLETYKYNTIRLKHAYFHSNKYFLVSIISIFFNIFFFFRLYLYTKKKEVTETITSLKSNHS